MLNTLGRGAAGVAVPPAGFRLVEAACEEVGYIGNSWETLGALVGTQCTQRLQEKSWRRRLQRRRRLFPPVGRSSVPWRQRRREATRGATAIPGGHCVRPARRHSQSHFIKKGAKVENCQSMTNNGMLKFLLKVFTLTLLILITLPHFHLRAIYTPPRVLTIPDICHCFTLTHFQA